MYKPAHGELRVMDEAEKEIMKEVFKEAVPRTFMLKQEDFETHGYSAGCPGCAALLRGTSKQKHTQECRDRMMRNNAEDDRVKRAHSRRQECAKSVMDADAEREQMRSKRKKH